MNQNAKLRLPKDSDALSSRKYRAGNPPPFWTVRTVVGCCCGFICLVIGFTLILGSIYVYYIDASPDAFVIVPRPSRLFSSSSDSCGVYDRHDDQDGDVGQQRLRYSSPFAADAIEGAVFSSVDPLPADKAPTEFEREARKRIGTSTLIRKVRISKSHHVCTDVLGRSKMDTSLAPHLVRSVRPIRSWEDAVRTERGAEVMTLNEHLHDDNKNARNEQVDNGNAKKSATRWSSSRDDPFNVTATTRHRILCLSYTVIKNHARASTMYRTWGRHCDQHLIFTNGASIDGVPAEAVVTITPAIGIEEYTNVWQKIRSLHRWVVSNRFPPSAADFNSSGAQSAPTTAGVLAKSFSRRASFSHRQRSHGTLRQPSSLQQQPPSPLSPQQSMHGKAVPRIRPFDYIFVGGDDVFLFVPNLRRYLMEHSYPQQMEREGGPVFMGYRHDPAIVQSTTPPFISGAGYVMNEFAWFLLVDIAVTSCHQGTMTHAEDVISAECLGQWGVEASDARDEWGEDRFQVMSPGYMSVQAGDPDYTWWVRDYRDRPQAKGADIMSQFVTLMHYVQPHDAFSLYQRFQAPLDC